MNVLISSHLYPSCLSQLAGSFVHNQVRFLKEHCHIESIVPTPWFPLPGFGRWSAYRKTAARERMDGVEVRRPRYVTYPRRFMLAAAWRSYLKALKGASDHVPDVIHAHCAYPDGLAAVHYGRSIGRPVVITVHGHDMKDLSRHPRWRSLIREALQGADAVIAVSEELARLVEEVGEVARSRVKRIPNGVDCSLFGFDGKRRAGENGWNILYVGRFDPAKGIGLLLEASATLIAQGRDLQVRLVGGGTSTGKGEEFRRQAHELGIADKVTFVDEVAWQDIARHMAAADLFVLPSFSEGFPLVIVEALASGLPVVATRCGGPEEVVGEGVGRLAAVGDAADLQRQIAHVIDHYDSYDRASIRQLAEEQFDYSKIALRIKSVYDEVVEKRLGVGEEVGDGHS